MRLREPSFSSSFTAAARVFYFIFLFFANVVRLNVRDNAIFEGFILKCELLCLLFISVQFYLSL